MKAGDLKHIFHSELDAIYGKDEVESFFYLSAEHHFYITRLQLALEPELTFTGLETDIFFKILEALKQQKPIQYILGETNFYGLTFKMNSNVLIPRPETEELVDWIIKNQETHQNLTQQNDFQNKRPLHILDIGTGSGCIAISLAKHIINAKVYALDISNEALELAKDNADRNAVDISCIAYDILSTSETNSILETLKFDIIVSNPPYVRHSEKTKMKPNVLENEPGLALFVDDEDPLKFYKTITHFAVNKLKSQGHLFFEINQYLGAESKRLLEDANFKHIELRKDINGNDRMLKGQLI